MPAEWKAHSKTIMAWPGEKSHSYWPPGNFEQILSDVIRVVKAISQFESVTLFVPVSRVGHAKEELLHLTNAVDIICVEEDDLKPWMRDIAPTFVVSKNSTGLSVCALDFNFNGWGEKDQTKSNRQLAPLIIRSLKVSYCSVSIVAEGGALETDGEGTLLVTESSLINPNRNPGMDKAAIEKELKRALGISTIIWLPGICNEDTTDCHVDALVRFVRPGLVVLSRPPPTRGEVWTRVYNDARRFLADARDSKGRALQAVDIAEPDISTIKDAEPEMIPSYVNYYHAEGAILIPQFGCPKTDAAALGIFGHLFPDKEIVPVYLHGLPNAGGGLHCITQQVPSLENMAPEQEELVSMAD
jgi:agmatine deiminase